MKITVITAFPELMRNYLASSVLGRGIAAGKLEAEVVDIRDFSEGSYRQIDDYCYGSGGMMLMAEPLAKAVESVSGGAKPYVVYPSPQGVRLHQELVEDLARKEHLVIVCGHYEGVDERFTEKYVDMEISLGDFVLTGGEMPAMAIVDAVSRLIPGVVGSESSVEEDSFYSGMLDTPHYTRPAQWRGERVPEVLLNGDAKAIERWRRRQSVERTLDRRPDIAGRAGIIPWLSGGAYVMEVHYPVLDKRGRKIVHRDNGHGPARHRARLPHLWNKEIPARHAHRAAARNGEAHRGTLDLGLGRGLQPRPARGPSRRSKYSPPYRRR